MPVIINRLETPQEIENYKLWLQGKSLRSLRTYLSIFNRNSKQSDSRYPNLKLRKDLVENEINSRLN